MGYFQSIYNNTRYIVFIQTRYHQNILPANDVSAHSLSTLLLTIGSYRGGMFRSIRIYRNEITTLKVYEMNFINYRSNVLGKSDFWKKIYQKFNNIDWLLNFILYHFVYLNEVDIFGNNITNNKPKYLVDKSKEFHDLLFIKGKDYQKNKDGKEIIDNIDFHNDKLYINEKEFFLKKGDKAIFFLEILSKYFTNNNSVSYVELFVFIDFYEKLAENENFNINYLVLNNDNIENGYLKTINKGILDIYDREILEIKKGYISFIEK